MHRTFLAVIVIVTINILYLCGCNNTNDDNILSAGISGQMPPYSYYHTDTNNLSGFDVDIATELARRMNMKLDLQLYDFNRLIPAVLNKQIDCGLGSMNIVPEREKMVDFSIPYNVSTGRFVVRESLININTVEDIKNSKQLIGVRNGTVYPKLLKEKYGFKESQLKIFPSQRDLSIALQKNIIDIAISDSGAMYHLNKHTNAGIKFIPDKITEANAGITVNKDNKKFLEKLNVALESMIKDGTHARLSQKWFGKNYTPLKPLKD